MRSHLRRVAAVAAAAAAALASIESRAAPPETAAPKGDGPEDHEDNTFGLPDGRPIRRRLKAFFAEQAAEVLGELPEIGAPLPDRFPPLADYDDPMASAMTPLIGAYWDRAGKMTRERLGLDPGEWRVIDPNLHRAIADSTLKFCAKTNATTSLRLDEALASLRTELHAGMVDAGETIPQLRRRVQSVFRSASRERAESIARTEASRAVHAASLMSAEASGVAGGKRWLASANSCDRCLELERLTKGAAVGLADPFASDASADPDYATVPAPPLHPHCRCTVVYDLDPEYAAMIEGEGGKAPASVAPLDAKKPRVRRPAKPRPPAFPDDPDSLEVVKKLGGSTGAELVKDRWGREWVRKRGANAAHLREEVLADEAYRKLGLAVPEAKLYETQAGPVKLARFIEGKTLGQLSGPALEEARAEVAKGFAADALLGNWDVVGMGLDNVLVDAKGKVYRIDNGGSLRYRAQGSPKAAAWNDYPTELWTLRDAAKNPQTAKVFGELPFGQLVDQIGGIKKTGAELGLPPDVAKVVDARLAQMRDVAKIGRTFLDDKFKDNYADGIAKHTMGLRAAGVASRLPKKLINSGVDCKDENGKPWDHLRGTGSIVGDLHKYVEASGGNPITLKRWMEGQAGSSWSDISVGVKQLLAGERDLPRSDYYWKAGVDADKKLGLIASKAGGLPRLRETIMAQHAFTGELIRRVEFANRSADGGTVTLIRTESNEALADAGLKPGESGKLRRGVAESTSVFKPYYLYGSHETVQAVPTHRVLAAYFQARYDGGSTGAFLGDHENEFLAMLDGVEVKVKGDGKAKAKGKAKGKGK